MSDKTLLDIDDTILTKNLLLPENKNEQNIDSMFKQFDTKAKYITIYPAPGICVKTKTLVGEKVFLNICTSDKIPSPQDISEEELVKILDDDDVTNFLIPMSIGEERLEADKGGIPCVTHDIVINTKYLEKCQAKQSFRIFTITVIMEGISNKFGRQLDPKSCIILKNVKVMGKLQAHRIEDREARKPLALPKPLIQEISSSPNLSSADNSNLANVQSKNFVILKEPLGEVTSRLIGLFQIPKGISCKDLTVLLNVDRIVVTANESKLEYDVFVPYSIIVDHAEASFDKDLRVLRLDMPVT